MTAILPRGRKFDPVFAAHHVLNGNGDMTGTHWVQESGFLETPILITNTGSVGVVRDAALGWMNRNKYFSPLIGHVWFAYPLVAETYDGVLNDMYGFHVKPEHVHAALDSAKSGPVAEGNVGGGTGMSCLGFKCGTGTASRRVIFGPTTNTVGVLVQANFGGRNQLTIAGVQVGREIKGSESKYELRPGAGAGDAAGRGSIIAIAATDAPLAPHQLRRIAQRISLGVGRTGGTAGNGSGDIFLAFSTANPGAFRRGGAELDPDDVQRRHERRDGRHRRRHRGGHHQRDDRREDHDRRQRQHDLRDSPRSSARHTQEVRPSSLTDIEDPMTRLAPVLIAFTFALSIAQPHAQNRPIRGFPGRRRRGAAAARRAVPQGAGLGAAQGIHGGDGRRLSRRGPAIVEARR